MAEPANVDDVIAAFTEDQVQRLTGLSQAQLRYWARTGFFAPQFATDRRTPYGGIYSFRDVVGLRILSILRNQNGVPLQQLRTVAEKLAHLAGELWSRTKLYVLNRKVAFDDPVSGTPREVVSGQYLLGIPLQVIVEDTRRAAAKLRRRQRGTIGRIDRHRDVSGNAEVIAGTRIPVSTILRFVEDGYSAGQIVKEYPTLTEADVAAAIRHAGRDEAA